jgi:phosphate transport system permease protein
VSASFTRKGWCLCVRFYRDRIARALLSVLAVVAGSGLVLIILFVLLEGWTAIPALVGTVWDSEADRFGLLPMVVGTVAVTMCAMVMAIPAGVGMALFLTEVAPLWIRVPVRSIIQALAGIPSVVYGFIGLSLLIPAIRSGLGGPGFSLLAGGLVLGVMVLPTIATISEDALRAVPTSLREGAAALGASPWQTVRRVLLPAARSGLITAVVLGLGRALGETMAVLMVTGNVAVQPSSVLDPIRTVTATIALEMGYATGRHRDALFAVGVLLLAAVLAVNAAARRWSR